MNELVSRVQQWEVDDPLFKVALDDFRFESYEASGYQIIRSS